MEESASRRDELLANVARLNEEFARTNEAAAEEQLENAHGLEAAIAQAEAGWRPPENLIAVARESSARKIVEAIGSELELTPQILGSWRPDDRETLESHR